MLKKISLAPFSLQVFDKRCQFDFMRVTMRKPAIKIHGYFDCQQGIATNPKMSSEFNVRTLIRVIKVCTLDPLKERGLISRSSIGLVIVVGGGGGWIDASRKPTFCLGHTEVCFAHEPTITRQVESVPGVERSATGVAGEAVQGVHVVVATAHHLWRRDPLFTVRTMGLEAHERFRFYFKMLGHSTR